VVLDTDKPMVVMEYYPQSSLHALIKRGRNALHRAAASRGKVRAPARAGPRCLAQAGVVGSRVAVLGIVAGTGFRSWVPRP
jgi:hypothetical protein